MAILPTSSAISLAALLITSLVLNGIITNVPVKAQTPQTINGGGNGTVTYSSCGIFPEPIPHPGDILLDAYLNPDGTVNTALPNGVNLKDFISGNIVISGQITAGGVSGSSFSLTVSSNECGKIITGTITGTCGTNQQITLDSTGIAAFTGMGTGTGVTCPIGGGGGGGDSGGGDSAGG